MRASGLRIRVRGQVQGVGFRPFVWALARRCGVSGSVSNDAEGVLVLARGGEIDAFVSGLSAEAPVLARVDAVEITDWDGAAEAFTIAASGAAGAETRVAPDAASCAECVTEIFGDGRRRGYGFTNCTNCGPRYTILRGLPYDRAQTTMSGFALCGACRAEYEDPGDRRFHAQPIACPDCGPRLWFERGGGAVAGDAIALAAAALRAGEIVAVKGLGGFHLCCDATQADAVALLRARKHRPAKPLALMARFDLLTEFARPSAAEAALLRDPAAPIVLLPKLAERLPEGVAPGQDSLGWMLPYTPLHHLLCAAVGRPLVMTSGNLSGAPQVIGNAEARDTLAGFADGFVMHDRDIARRLDDSVERITPQGPMVLRRARGRVPGTLPLPEGFEDRQVVAYGGQMKSAICLVKNGQALLGHHLGELDAALTWEAFLQADRDYAALFDHHPEAAACDLHPEFRASIHARATGLPLVEVQHHHAHLASCLGENLWPLEGGAVAGIVLDGLGLGSDGTVWGGELLLGDYHGFVRRGGLRPAPLPGGDAASRAPWRNLVMRLDQAGLGAEAERLLPGHPIAMLRQMVERGMNAPLSSSAGRLFDAFAAALGLCAEAQSFEGEAAMRLEALAAAVPECGAYALATEGGVIDPAPLFAAWRADAAAGADAGIMARRFHAGLAEAFAAPARALVERGEAGAVALSGGCFQNALLLDLTVRALGDVPVLIHRKTPANDGGLAFGQALVALAQLEAR